MKDNILVSIVIPVYNDLKLYKKCYILDFLKSFSNFIPSCNYELILVDDASPDLSYKKEIDENYKNINLVYIQNEKNLGFQKTVNKGLKISKGKYIIIGNQDVKITETSIINLVNYLEKNKDVAVVGPKMIFEDGKIFDSYRKFPTVLDYIIKRTFLKKIPFFKKRMRRYLMWDKDVNKTEEVDWLVFSWVCVRSDILKKLNYLDERFKFFNGDTDFCMKVWKNGYKVVYLSDSLIINSKRRLSQGGIKSLFFNKFILIHIIDALKFFWKWKYL